MASSVHSSRSASRCGRKFAFSDDRNFRIQMVRVFPRRLGRQTPLSALVVVYIRGHPYPQIFHTSLASSNNSSSPCRFSPKQMICSSFLLLIFSFRRRGARSQFCKACIHSTLDVVHPWRVAWKSKTFFHVRTALCCFQYSSPACEVPCTSALPSNRNRKELLKFLQQNWIRHSCKLGHSCNPCPHIMSSPGFAKVHHAKCLQPPPLWKFCTDGLQHQDLACTHLCSALSNNFVGGRCS